MYLQDDDGDDGHLGAEPGEETLELAALSNQVTVDDDGDQTHGLHGRLRREKKQLGQTLRLIQSNKNAQLVYPLSVLFFLVIILLSSSSINPSRQNTGRGEGNRY